MKHMVKTCEFIMATCFIISYGILLIVFTPTGGLLFIATSTFSLGVTAGLYILIRTVTFKKKMTEFIKQLLKGNFDAGIRSSRLFKDEIHQMEEEINKLGAQLKIYDVLRAERVDLSRRVLFLILKNVSQGIIIADMEKKIFQLNPAIQVLFHVEQEKVTFDAVEKQEGNNTFMALFQDVAVKEKVPKEGACSLQLNIHGLTRTISFKIAPLKDKKENVILALIFVDEALENSEK